MLSGMRRTLATLLLALVLLPACSSTPAHEERDPARRAELLGAVKALEGRWKATADGHEPSTHVVSVGSGGSTSGPPSAPARCRGRE